MCWDFHLDFFVLLLYELDRIIIFNSSNFLISGGRLSRMLHAITPSVASFLNLQTTIGTASYCQSFHWKEEVWSFLNRGFKNLLDPHGIPDLSIVRISKTLFFTVYHYLHCIWKPVELRCLKVGRQGRYLSLESRTQCLWSTCFFFAFLF